MMPAENDLFLMKLQDSRKKNYKFTPELLFLHIYEIKNSAVF